jgi:hypothetical protein
VLACDEIAGLSELVVEESAEKHSGILAVYDPLVTAR